MGHVHTLTFSKKIETKKNKTRGRSKSSGQHPGFSVLLIWTANWQVLSRKFPSVPRTAFIFQFKQFLCLRGGPHSSPISGIPAGFIRTIKVNYFVSRNWDIFYCWTAACRTAAEGRILFPVIFGDPNIGSWDSRVIHTRLLYAIDIIT